MVRPNPALSYWERLLPHFRAGDWDRCIRELRPVLDADEDALDPRLLCAGLHLAAAQPVLALLHYETLLPLAVGQGQFFAAVAVQKRLDLLHPTSVTHARRYEVLRRWFISLGRNRRVLPGERPGELSEAALLDLDAEAFTRVIEGCKVEGLDPGPRVLREALNSSRMVLYGRALWSLDLGDGVTLLEGIAEAGQAISVDPGLGSGARLVLNSELPTEMLLFGPETLEALRPSGRPAKTAARAPDHAEASSSEPSPAPIEAPALAPLVPIARPPLEAMGPAEHGSPTIDASVPGPRTRATPVARPRPDPRFEPFAASAAPVERRRESRIAINLASGVARLGLADTRVAPLGGHLKQLSADYLELVFPRAELRHLRTRLEGSCIGLQFNFGPELAHLICTGRVRYTTAMGTGAEANDLTLEIEVLPLRSGDGERMVEAVRQFATRGQGGPAAQVA